MQSVNKGAALLQAVVIYLIYLMDWRWLPPVLAFYLGAL